MSQYELNIDGSSAESGAKKIVKSFDDIKAAADRMEAGVTKSAQKASSAFNAMKGNGPSQQAITSIRELGSAFRTFKGPSKAASANTVSFLQALKAVGSVKVSAGGISGILGALANYKGPSAASAKNTQGLLRALSGFSGMASTRGVAPILASLAGFKGPGANAARNTRALLSAVSSFKAPSGLGAASRAFIKLAEAADKAHRSVKNVKSVAAGGITVKNNMGQLSNGTRHLAKSHGMLHGALLKTTTAYHALGSILGAGLVIKAANEIIKIKAQLEAATGSAAQARVQFGFLREYAEDLGLEFTQLAKSYGFFLGAIKGTNVSFGEAKQIFVGFTTAARALQLSTSDVEGVFRALGQIMSKGKLQAEELRGQLGDRLPGAFVRMARALDMTKPGELDAALKKGAISGDMLNKGLLRLANTLETEFAAGAVAMSKTVDAAFNRLKNSFTFASDALGQSGMNEALINIMDTLRGFLESEGFDTSMKVIAAGFKLIGDNIEFVAAALSGLAAGAMAKWVLGLGAAGSSIAGMSRALMVARVVALRFGAAIVAMGMLNFAASIGHATKAFATLNLVMKANIIGMIVTVIGLAVTAFIMLREKTNDVSEAMGFVNKTMSDAQNYYDAYIAKVYDSTTALASENSELRTNLLLKLQQAESGAYSVGKAGSTRQLLPFGLATSRTNGGAGAMTIGGVEITDPALLEPLRKLTTVRDGKVYIRKVGRTADQLVAFNKYASSLQGLTEDSPNNTQAAAIQKAFMPAARARSDAQVRTYQVDPSQFDYDPQAVLRGTLGGFDYNNPNGIQEGLSGEVPVGDAGRRKARTGKSKAQTEAEQDAADVERAVEGLRDLRQEVEFAQSEIDAILKGSEDAITARAQSAATEQLQKFQDAFGSPERAQKGIIELGRTLQVNGHIAADTALTYEDMSEAVKKYIEATEKAAEESRNEAGVAKSIAAMREENAIRSELILDYQSGAMSLEEFNRQLEIEQALIGTGGNRDELLKRLNEETLVRAHLNRQMEVGNTLRDLQSRAMVEGELASLYGQGLNEEDLNYYRQMYEERERLIGLDYYGDELRGMLAMKKMQLELTDVVGKAQEEEEKLRRISIDQADAIVDGFKKGAESGQSFLRTMKDIFSSLKDIMLDFVLYNPLQEFLKDFLNPVNAQGFRSRTAQTSLNILDTAPSLLGAFGSMPSVSKSPVSPSQAANDPAVQAVGTATGEAAGEAITRLVVTGVRVAQQDTNAPIDARVVQKNDPFTKLKGLFDYKANKRAIREAFKDSTSAGVSAAAQAAGKAFAAFGVGKAVGSALGFGRTGSNVLGGAAAGFTVGGPVGAAIGAGIALVGSLLSKKKDVSEYSSITVGAGGYAEAGAGNIYGKGDRKAQEARAQAGADLFNQFAITLGGTLKAGNFGTFGAKDFKKDDTKDKIPFYSATGRISRKGDPLGKEGVDWVRGTDSEVQAFALKTQINKGQITGVSESIKTVARNTRSTTLEGLQGDFQVAEAYDEFIGNSKSRSDVARQVEELNKAYKKLAAQTKRLGLEENKLSAARDRMLNTMKKEFDYQISQGILGFENPAQAAYNDLLKEYKETVENGMAVGGDLLAVEKYFGLKRVELTKQVAQEQANVYRDLLTELTATSNSPLNAGTVFANARDRYSNLRAEIASGNLSNIGSLSDTTGNYLSAAREVFSSGFDYFSIFNEVTSFLESMSASQNEAAGNVDVPSLPALDAIVAEITARNSELVAVNKEVGATVAGMDLNNVTELQKLGLTLEQIRAILGGESIFGPRGGMLSPQTNPLATIGTSASLF